MNREARQWVDSNVPNEFLGTSGGRAALVLARFGLESNARRTNDRSPPLLMNLWKMLKALFTPTPRIRAREGADRMRKGEAVLIDVREPREWTEGVAEGAVLLPLTDLTGARKQWTPFLAEMKDRELLLYCAAGGRSAIAARVLAAEGMRTVNAGSLSEWAAAGWPIVQPPRRR